MIASPWSCRGARQAMCDLNSFVIALSRHTREGISGNARRFSIRGLADIRWMQCSMPASSSKWLCWFINTNHNFHWRIICEMHECSPPPWSCRGKRQAICNLNSFVIALSRHTREGFRVMPVISRYEALLTSLKCKQTFRPRTRNDCVGLLILIIIFIDGLIVKCTNDCLPVVMSRRASSHL